MHYEGKLKLAAVYYGKAEQRKYESPAFSNNYGIVLAKLGRIDEAMREFSTAARLDPYSAQPHFLMGRLLLQQGNDAEALAKLRMAIKLDPNNLDQLLLAASVLAADENPSVRNGPEALKLTEWIVRLAGDKQPVALDALAWPTPNSDVSTSRDASKGGHPTRENHGPHGRA